MKRKMSDLKIVLTIFLVFFLLFGVIFTIVSSAIGKKTQKDREVCTSRTEGVVVDVLKESVAEMHDTSDIPSYSYFPVVEYKAGSGTIRKRDFFGGKKDDFAIGDKVTVFYDPLNPEHFYLDGKLAGTTIRVFRFVGIGMLAAAAVVGFFVARLR